MAERYLAVFSSDSAAIKVRIKEIHTTSGLSLVFETATSAVFVSEGTRTVPLGTEGLLIGRVFSSGSHSARINSLEPGALRQVLSSKGAALFRAIWGGYIAITGDIRNTLHVLRDPSGAMPCLYIRDQGCLLLTSDVDTLFTSGVSIPEVDFAFLERFLFAYDLRTPGTALKGLKELLAGSRLSASGDEDSVDQCWSPWDHIAIKGKSPNDDDVEQLRETVSSCVKAWTGEFSHIVLGVSGGLDSSIIASCIQRTPTALTCLTMATYEGEGDERRYARLLAEHLGASLVEAFHDLSEIDVTQSTSKHLARPVLCAFAQSEFKTRLQLAQSIHADALFTGIGGDNVFCFLQSASPILDRMQVEGLTPGIVTTTFDVCRLTGCSLGEALTTAVRRLRRSPQFRWSGDPRFLTAEAVSRQSQSLDHPWLTAPFKPLPGKAAHVAMLTRIQATTDGLTRRVAPQINPLLSQPIQELCLSIPTWKWCQNGVNRAVARQAFSADLPQQLIDRRSKGGPNTFAYEVVSKNRKVLVDLMAGGFLASAGFLNMNEISSVLESPGPIKGFDHMRLGLIAEVEAWSRYWTDRRTRSGRTTLHGAATVRPLSGVGSA